MENKTFEEHIRDLQSVTESIKNPENSLEDVMNFYKEGMDHYKFCLKYLDDAQQTIETMMEEAEYEE